MFVLSFKDCLLHCNPFRVISRTKFGTCIVVSVNRTLVEAKMHRFHCECEHFSFNKRPNYTHDGASAKFSSNSHEKDVFLQYTCIFSDLRDSLRSFCRLLLSSLAWSSHPECLHCLPFLPTCLLYMSRLPVLRMSQSCHTDRPGGFTSLVIHQIFLVRIEQIHWGKNYQKTESL
jgi:hypothetical protein